MRLGVAGADTTLVGLHDGTADREAQARAGLFGGAERLEHAGAHVSGHTGSVVDDTEFHFAFIDSRRDHRDGANLGGRVGHGLQCIADQVEEHLLDLHRVHAAFLPSNIASRRVLEKNGFVEEGYAERYLQINGRWEDHVLMGLTEERWAINRLSKQTWVA